jgi:hypothetical protein
MDITNIYSTEMYYMDKINMTSIKNQFILIYFVTTYHFVVNNSFINHVYYILWSLYDFIIVITPLGKIYHVKY